MVTKKEEKVKKLSKTIKESEKSKEPKESKEIKEVKESKPEKYYQAVGRRKTATARVRLYTKGSGCFVNDKDYKEYFSIFNLQRIVESPLKKMKSLERFKIVASVYGGGSHSQAEAVRHAVSRALVVFNSDFRKRLKKASYLTRDPRKKERKKYGLKKARKSPRWSKR